MEETHANYNIKAEHLKTIALNLGMIVAFSWLILSAGIVQVLHMYDRTTSFVVILVIGIVVNAIQMSVAFLYMLGYVLHLGETRVETESKDNE